MDGDVVAAAFIKTTPKRAVLKCLWVHPGHQRRGWATSLVAHAANALAESGETTLRSFVQLANPESLAWHHGFGFREVPDARVASARWRHYQWEYRRLKKAGTRPEEIAATESLMNHWRVEYERLEAIAHENYAAAHSLLDH